MFMAILGVSQKKTGLGRCAKSGKKEERKII